MELNFDIISRELWRMYLFKGKQEVELLYFHVEQENL